VLACKHFIHFHDVTSLSTSTIQSVSEWSDYYPHQSTPGNTGPTLGQK